MRTCATQQCPTLIDTGSHCDIHTKARRKASDARRPSSQARGYTAQHRKDRATYFAAHPLCQDASGCIAPATDLDHIDGDPFNREWSNYRALCSIHHKRRTARDQPGGWHA